MTKLVRLEEDVIELIKTYVKSIDANAHVYVFGSRANLNKRGGDIDLFILSAIFSYEESRQLRFKIEDLIGEQKIDVLFAKDTSDPFIRSIFQKAVKL